MDPLVNLLQEATFLWTYSSLIIGSIRLLFFTTSQRHVHTYLTPTPSEIYSNSEENYRIDNIHLASVNAKISKILYKSRSLYLKQLSCHCNTQIQHFIPIRTCLCSFPNPPIAPYNELHYYLQSRLEPFDTSLQENKRHKTNQLKKL